MFENAFSVFCFFNCLKSRRKIYNRQTKIGFYFPPTIVDALDGPESNMFVMTGG